jgi:hypothetical protein
MLAPQPPGILRKVKTLLHDMLERNSPADYRGSVRPSEPMAATLAGAAAKWDAELTWINYPIPRPAHH